MSHAIVVVMAGSRRQAELLLAPYDKNLLVDPYDCNCSCIGQIAKDDIFARSLKKFGSNIDMWTKCCQENPGKDLKELQRIYTKDYVMAKKQWEKNEWDIHPEVNHANPHCPLCHGTKTITTTNNPVGKYLSYVWEAGWADWALATDPSLVGTPAPNNATFQVPNAILTFQNGWDQKYDNSNYAIPILDEENDKEWVRSYFDTFQYALDNASRPFVFNYEQ